MYSTIPTYKLQRSDTHIQLNVFRLVIHSQQLGDVLDYFKQTRTFVQVRKFGIDGYVEIKINTTLNRVQMVGALRSRNILECDLTKLATLPLYNTEGNI